MIDNLSCLTKFDEKLKTLFSLNAFASLGSIRSAEPASSVHSSELSQIDRIKIASMLSIAGDAFEESSLKMLQ